MASKTFKIGEYAQGGIIQAEVKGKKIAIICRDMFGGTNKELDRTEVQEDESGAQWTLTDKLNEWTTHYYAEKVMDWIKEKSKIKTSFFR